MRTLVLIIGILCGYAQGVAASEPFNLQKARALDAEMERLRQEVRTTKADEILRIKKVVDEILRKEKLDKDEGLAWVNQEVQMSSVIGGDNNCLAKAVAKCEIAYLQGMECRIVGGTTRSSRMVGATFVAHAMAAIRRGDEWVMLDNQHIISRFMTPTDKQVAGYKNVSRFNVDSVYEY